MSGESNAIRKPDDWWRPRLILSPCNSLAMGVFIVVVSVAFTLWRAIPGDLVYFQRDITFYWLPHIEVFRAAVFSGELPLWNPYEVFGTPLLADPSIQLLYPPTWLVLLLPPIDYYRLFVVLHAVLGGLGVFVLGRRFALDPIPAAVSGSLFAVSGPFLSAANLFHHYAGAAWMPWVLAGLGSLRSAPGIRRMFVLAFAITAQILAGSGDLCLMTALLGLFWLAWHYLSLAAPKGRPRFFLWLSVAMALAGTITAAHWLPAIVMVREGSRQVMSLTSKTYWSIHPVALLDLWLPRFVEGLPLSAAARMSVFEGREPLFASLYLGAAALPLAILGLLYEKRIRRFALPVLALSLIVAIGKHLPLLSFFWTIPGIAWLRYPTKFALPAVVGWVLLVGSGAAVWGRSWEARERLTIRWALLLVSVAAAAATTIGIMIGSSHPWITQWLDLGGDCSRLIILARFRALRAAMLLALGAIFLAIRARNAVAPRQLTLAGVVIVLGDVMIAGQAVNPMAPRILLEARPALLQRFPSDTDSRIFVVSRNTSSSSGASLREKDPSQRSLTLQTANKIEILSPLTGMRYGLYGSFDGDFTALLPHPLGVLMYIAHRHPDMSARFRLLRLSGVDFIVDSRESQATLNEVARESTILGDTVRLVRVPNSLPKVFVVEGVRPQRGDGVAQLLHPSFEPERFAIVAGAKNDGEARPGFMGRAQIKARSANRLVIDAMANRQALVVVLESFRSGWRARVDGRNVPVMRANVLFRGVRLSAGRHRIQMFYRPWTTYAGAALSGLGLLGAAMLWFAGRRRCFRNGESRAVGACGLESSPRRSAVVNERATI